MAKRICTLPRARLSAVCIVLSAVIVCVPTYVMYGPRQLTTDAAAAPAEDDNSVLGFAFAYEPGIPRNLSTAAVESGIGDPQRHSERTVDTAGYWFNENPFVGQTFRSANFWVYGVARPSFHPEVFWRSMTSDKTFHSFLSW